MLRLKSSKQTASSIKLNWNDADEADKYVVYGNACGKKNHMAKIAELDGKSLNVKKVAKGKVKKGTYYKFIVIALDSNDAVVSISKAVHVATKGGKAGNPKSVKTKAKKNKVTIKKGKTFRLSGKAVSASKKLKVTKYRAVSYESSNSGVAGVSKKGVIKARAKGTCYVYAYAQNEA